jgi:Cu/Ag efflux protein CusF
MKPVRRTVLGFAAFSALAQFGVLTPTNAASHLAANKKTTGAPDELVTGEVRRIDKQQKKITLRHEEIKNLEMPAMSMVFNVSDAALLDKVAVGDKVRFHAEKIDGALYVTAIEK